MGQHSCSWGTTPTCALATLAASSPFLAERACSWCSWTISSGLLELWVSIVNLGPHAVLVSAPPSWTSWAGSHNFKPCRRLWVDYRDILQPCGLCSTPCAYSDPFSHSHMRVYRFLSQTWLIFATYPRADPADTGYSAVVVSWLWVRQPLALSSVTLCCRSPTASRVILWCSTYMFFLASEARNVWIFSQT